MTQPKKLALYQIDAFTTALFAGNPAAVCPLEAWLEKSVLAAIAAENNLSEIAFFVKREDSSYELRWFTPVMEVNLCGHATLASAFVIFTELDPGATRVAVLASEDYFVVYESEDEVRNLTPDFGILNTFALRGVSVTAPGVEVNFVSRFFAPKAGIPEDPVTGSAHCALAPYWAERLEKKQLHARQVSPRGGELFCDIQDDRVLIAGHAVKYLQGEITLTPGSLRPQ